MTRKAASLWSPCVSRSVGWLGAGAGFLAVAIVGMTSQDPQMVRAA